MRGERAGEVLALRWDDVDLNRSVVKVKSSRTRTAAGYDDGKPKTTAGQRAIPLVARAVEELRAHQRYQKEQKFAAGEAWVDEDRVFPSSTAKATDPSNLRKHWVRLLARTGLPPIHFHDLRHSAASWLIASGVPIPEVSRILGHAGPSITMRIYAHAMPDVDTRVVAAMERMFGTDRDTARG